MNDSTQQVHSSLTTIPSLPMLTRPSAWAA
jgi:hypothetical protein